MLATLRKGHSEWSGGNSWCKGAIKQRVAGMATKSDEVWVALGSKSKSGRR